MNWFAILSGSLPFENQEEDKNIFSKLEFNPTIWGKYSRNIVDLISKCLKKNPIERINIDELVNNKCFLIKH